MTVDANHPMFDALRAPGPWALSNSQATELAALINRSPSLRQQLLNHYSQNPDRPLEWGAPGAGTRVLYPNDIPTITIDPTWVGGQLPFNAADWIWILSHEVSHALSPLLNPSLASSFNEAVAIGVQGEASAVVNEFLNTLEANSAPGASPLTYNTDALVPLLEATVRSLGSDATRSQKEAVLTGAALSYYANQAPSTNPEYTYHRYYAEEWAAALSGRTGPSYVAVRGSIRVLDIDDDGRPDLIAFAREGSQVLTDFLRRNEFTGAFVEISGSRVESVHTNEAGWVSNVTWSIDPTGEVNTNVTRVVDGQTLIVQWRSGDVITPATITSLLINGQPPTNNAEALSLANGVGVTPQGFATRTVGPGTSKVDTLGMVLRYYDATLPVNQTSGATVDKFGLTITPTPATGAAEREGVFDPMAEADAVNSGVVDAGGGWSITADPNELNLDQTNSSITDNTASAAWTRILADDYRPGNGNLADAVFDTDVLDTMGGNFSASGSLLGAALNTGDALAQLIAPTDPLILDLNGNGVRLTDFATDPVLFDIDNDGGSREQTGWVDRIDGLVVHDLNGNGHIDGIQEALSEYYNGTTGTGGAAGTRPFLHGLAALKSLDSNSDNQFTAADAAFNQLRIWVDANHDGLSFIDTNANGVLDFGEASELVTLASLGVVSINLAATRQSGLVRDGNEVLASSSFVQNVNAAGVGVPVGTSGSTQQTREALAINLIANPAGHMITGTGSGLRVTTQATGASGTPSAYVSRFDPTFGGAQPSATKGETINLAAGTVGTPTTAGGVTTSSLPGGASGTRNSYGSVGNDTLIGDASNNWLVGGAGSDRFDAGAGDDVLLIDGNDQPENINGGAGTDIVQVVGNAGVSLNLAESGIEIAQGGRGDDVFIGGGRSSVFARGGAGDDVLIGGAANDALSGEDGADLIDGGGGNDVLRGHRDRDVLLGGAGDDLLDGGQADDQLNGGAGADVLLGGQGDDTLDGGAGVDIVEFSGSFADYRFVVTPDGVRVIDSVAGRDGADLLRDVERANFRDVSRVEIPSTTSAGLTNPLPVRDVLTRDVSGQLLTRTQAHTIGKSQLLANDIDFQGNTLSITQLFDVQGGSATINGSGDVVFTPLAGWSGFMGFKYTIQDSQGNLAATVTQEGTTNSSQMRAAVHLRTPDLPTDPLLTDQWYLSQSNILPVWDRFTGRGVRIGQFEPGGEFSVSPEVLDFRHPDLQPNIDAAWLAEARTGQRAGEGSGDRFSTHATLVAGVMAAARNGEGAVGVAYDAKLAGHWIANDGTNLDALNLMVRYDVANNSWSASPNFVDSFDTNAPLAATFINAARNGRGGLGTAIVMAGGNDRLTGGNTNHLSISNNRYSIVTGGINAMTDLGTLQVGQAPFSNPGASILVSAPASNVTSTARAMANDNGSVFGREHEVTQGTSFATPIVSGIVALMLEANPQLGYRDIQEILALSARRVVDASTQWQWNGATTWNGGAMQVSHDYGYGQVDAQAAVRLAESWSTQQSAWNLYSLPAPITASVNQAIPDNATVGVASSILVSNTPLRVEHVEVKLTLTHARAGDLDVRLISPSGTESILLDRPGKAPGSPATDRGDLSFDGSSTLSFTLGSVRHRGEAANGTWQLRVSDRAGGDLGTFTSWSLNLFGEQDTGQDRFVFTDDFASAEFSSRTTISDGDGGTDTINVAAVSGASSVNLATGTASIAGRAVTIASPGNFEGVIGGDANDSLTGHAGSNRLYAGRGADIIVAGAGVDLVDGGFGNDTLTGGADADGFVFNPEPGAADVITDFSLAADRIVLSRFGTTTGNSVNATQSGSDALISLDAGQTIRLLGVNASLLTSAHFVSIPEGLAARDLDEMGDFGFGTDGSDPEVVLSNGNAVFVAGAGADLVFGGTGRDRIHGGEGADTLVGENSSDATTGGADELFGGDGADALYGAAGNDTLRGGAGLDLLYGGHGADVIYMEGDQGYSGLAGGTILGSINVSGAGVIQAFARGNGGADRFVIIEDRSASASTGIMRDLIDDFDVAAGGDVVDLSGIRTVSSFADLSYSALTVDGVTAVRIFLGPLATGTQYITLLGVSSNQLNASHFIFADGYRLQPLPLLENVTGSTGADTLNGDAGGNTLDGGAGADRLIGRTGDDSYKVDDTGDVIEELPGGGFDTIRSSVTYTLPVNVENLTLTGTTATGATGTAQANRVVGNVANNLIDGAQGSDTMLGGAGNDTYVVDDQGDTVLEQEGAGTDEVRSSVSFTLGEHVEALVLLGQSRINGTGNALANTVVGNAAGNMLDGGLGSDSMSGGDGDDTYFVDSAGDLVSEGTNEGRDTVVSSISYVLGQNLENLSLAGGAMAGTGNALDNEIIGNAFGNVLSGLDGHDRLDGRAGADTLIGGGGNDTYAVSDALDTLVEDAGGGTDRVETSIDYTLATNFEQLVIMSNVGRAGTGNAVANLLIGGAGADTLSGLDGSDSLFGSAGNDILDGGPGTDSMSGGSQDDAYYVGESTDIVSELFNDGLDSVYASVSFTLAGGVNGHIENLLLTGGALDGTGNEYANTLVGNVLANTLRGEGGSDTIGGADGHDTIHGGVGQDSLYGERGDDVILGGDDYDLVFGGEGNDAIVGEGAGDIVFAQSGNDLADGGAGTDVLFGQEGDDVLFGDAADDQLIGGDGNDTIAGHRGGVSTASGNDVIYGDTEVLSLVGGSDQLDGDGGDDIIVGGGGNDVILGDHGNDIIEGNAGADLMGGSAASVAGPETTGSDLFVYREMSDAGDVIYGFDVRAGDNDGFDFRPLFDTLGYAGTDPRADGWLRVRQSGADTLVEVDANGPTGGASWQLMATLIDVSASAVTDSMFMFQNLEGGRMMGLSGSQMEAESQLDFAGADASWLAAPAVQRWLAARALSEAEGDSTDTAADTGGIVRGALLAAATAGVSPLQQLIAAQENRLAA